MNDRGELARLRRYLALTQRDVSMCTGIPMWAISAAESGRRPLNEAQARVLREFLGTRLQILREGNRLEETSVSDDTFVN